MQQPELHFIFHTAPLRICAVFFLLCSFLTTSTAQHPISSLRDVLQLDLRLHPEAQVNDLYKIVYQGAFGIGHLIENPAYALRYLQQEISQLDTVCTEPLLQICAPDSSQFRVNLRPFLAAGYDINTLGNAMMESIQYTQADTAGFPALWKTVGDILKEIAPDLYKEQYAAFTADVKKNGYSAYHHSQKYRSQYHPAYRVLHRQAIQKFFPGMLPPAP